MIGKLMFPSFNCSKIIKDDLFSFFRTYQILVLFSLLNCKKKVRSLFIVTWPIISSFTLRNKSYMYIQKEKYKSKKLACKLCSSVSLEKYVQKIHFSFSFKTVMNCLTIMINRFDNLFIKCSSSVSAIFYKTIL